MPSPDRLGSTPPPPPPPRRAGLTLTLYLKSPWNVFDALIVLASLGDFFDLSTSGSFTALRSLRVLRALRVLRTLQGFEELRRLVETVMKSLPETGVLVLLMFLVMFVYTCLGMHLYGGMFMPPPEGRWPAGEEVRAPRPPLQPRALSFQTKTKRTMNNEFINNS